MNAQNVASLSLADTSNQRIWAVYRFKQDGKFPAVVFPRLESGESFT